ncbi:MAG: FliO/MopB family protein [Planctomycetota bacterium]
MSAQNIIVSDKVVENPENSAAAQDKINYNDFESKRLWQKTSSQNTSVEPVKKPKSVWQVILQLAGGLVLMSAIVIACYVFVRKFFPGSGNFFANSATEVLGRTYLDSKRYLALVRVGKKVLLLGVAPEEINCLSEITDKDDIADIMRDARPKTEAGKGIFKGMLEGRVAVDDAEQSIAKSAADGGGDLYTSEMAEIKNKLKNLRI